MNYRTVADLAALLRGSLDRIPNDVDLIAGIPRSGLLVANLLSLYLNCPMTDIEGLLEDRIISVGQRGLKRGSAINNGNHRHILVVDDSMATGASLAGVRQRLSHLCGDCRLTFLVVYGTGQSGESTDIVLETVDLPRVFEWNAFHHEVMEDACVDLDGVLCRDPSEDENDDDERYIDFMENVLPLMRLSGKCRAIVTCRLEKYRKRTEAWLARNECDYTELIMMPYASKAERILAARYAEFKAEAYARTGARLFIESSIDQAYRLAELTGLPVLCIESNEMLTGVTPRSGKALWFRSFKMPAHWARRFLWTHPRLCKVWSKLKTWLSRVRDPSRSTWH